MKSNNETNSSKLFKIIISIIIPIIILMIPTEALGDMLMLKGVFTVIHQRVLAIFVLVIFLWVLEPVPAYVTSIIIMTLFIVMVSDGGLKFFISNLDKKELISSKSIYAYLGDKIIILFLASFFVARTFEKFGIDVAIAKFIVNVFSGNPALTMLASVMVIGILSMFLPNTAITAIFISALMPLIKSFSEDDPGRVGFILSVPFAANIGGRGTIIGSPPNAIAVGLLPPDHTISFMEWASYSAPFTLVLLFILWAMLVMMYPFKTKKMSFAGSDEKTSMDKSFHAMVSYIVFVGYMVLLFLTDILGLDSYSISFLAIAVYFATGTMKKNDLFNIEWDLIFFMAGAIALGGMMKASGLANIMITSMPLSSVGPWGVIIFVSFAAYFLGTFMSYSAATALIAPLVFPLADIIPGFEAIGGMKTLAITVAYSASSAMALPVTTPPNALAYSKGILKNKMQMAVPGISIGIISLVLSWGMIYLLTSIGIIKY